MRTVAIERNLQLIVAMVTNLLFTVAIVTNLLFIIAQVTILLFIISTAINLLFAIAIITNLLLPEFLIWAALTIWFNIRSYVITELVVKITVHTRDIKGNLKYVYVYIYTINYCIICGDTKCFDMEVSPSMSPQSNLQIKSLQSNLSSTLFSESSTTTQSTYMRNSWYLYKIICLWQLQPNQGSFIQINVHFSNY